MVVEAFAIARSFDADAQQRLLYWFLCKITFLVIRGSDVGNHR